MSATVTFYRRLGLTIPEADPDWTSHHRTAQMSGDIDLDFDSAEFAVVWDKGWSSGTRMGVLGFRVSSREEVDTVYRDLRRLVTRASRSHTTRSGAHAMPLSRTLTVTQWGL